MTTTPARLSRDDLVLYATKGLETLRIKGTDLRASANDQGGFSVPEDL